MYSEQNVKNLVSSVLELEWVPEFSISKILATTPNIEHGSVNKKKKKIFWQDILCVKLFTWLPQSMLSCSYIKGKKNGCALVVGGKWYME